MNIEDYTLRIAQATPVQLVIINHELLISFLTEAISALRKNDTESFYQQINKSKGALTELMEGLNFEYEVAHNLYDIYIYAGERLNKALFGKDIQAAEEIKEIFEDLLEAWEAIKDTPDDRIAQAPENEKAQQVYAGLTYGRDGLDEYIPEDENRGFKA